MDIEFETFSSPGHIFTMGADDMDRLRSSELRMIICPRDTSRYSKEDLAFALTRLRAEGLKQIVTFRGSRADGWVEEWKGVLNGI